MDISSLRSTCCGYKVYPYPRPVWDGEHIIGCTDRYRCVRCGKKCAVYEVGESAEAMMRRG